LPAVGSDLAPYQPGSTEGTWQQVGKENCVGDMGLRGGGGDQKRKAKRGKHPKKKRWKMKGIFWNIRGLGKKGRTQCVAEIIRKWDLEFIGLQETKSMEFSDKYLDSLARKKQFCWNWLPSKGSAGGILMGLDKDLFELENWACREFL
jgi:hypothetical protein